MRWLSNLQITVVVVNSWLQWDDEYTHGGWVLHRRTASGLVKTVHTSNLT